MLRVLNRESVERQGRGAHEVTRRIWRFKTSWLALRGHLLAVSKTAKGKPPPGSPGTASPNCKAVEDVLPSSLPFTAVTAINSAKAALSAVRMDREVLAGVVRQCAVHNGRTTDGR